VRKQAAKAVIIGSARGAHRQYRSSGDPQPVSYGCCDPIKLPIGRVVNDHILLRHAWILVLHKPVDYIVGECDADRDRPREFRKRIPALRHNCVSNRCQVGDAEEISSAMQGHIPKLPDDVHRFTSHNKITPLRYRDI
jgi:hypothetical protein